MGMLRKIKSIAIWLLAAVMLFAVMSNVMAMGTPDEETPAEETVCDGLVGPLFGLCNAYCEAMDCDSDFPAASQHACDKVAANFAKQTEGMTPPCEEEVVCPCSSLEVDKIFEAYGDQGQCFGEGTPPNVCPTTLAELTEDCGVEDFQGADQNFIFIGEPEVFCATDIPLEDFLPLNAEEYEVCAAQINEYCTLVEKDD